MSTTLDPQTVTKIAKLARLDSNPSQDFLQKYGVELGAILGYVAQLQEINTTGISPHDGVRTITIDALRDDEPDTDTSGYSTIRSNIIGNFQNKQGTLLVLPGIFE